MEAVMPEIRSRFAEFTSNAKRVLSERRSKLALAIAASLGLAGIGAFQKFYLKPQRAIADIQYQSHLGLMRLYDLQMAYHGANGAYANDLDTLLMSAPDGAQLREQLKASVDINTLAVLGDAKRFRLEANVLDPRRTSVKIRGPLGKR